MSQKKIYKVVWLNYLGQLMENVEVVVYDIPKNLQVNGLLGMDFLTRTKAIILLDSGEVYFK